MATVAVKLSAYVPSPLLVTAGSKSLGAAGLTLTENLVSVLPALTTHIGNRELACVSTDFYYHGGKLRPDISRGTPVDRATPVASKVLMRKLAAPPAAIAYTPAAAV
jgi:hypothetical protein